jgi:transcriptional regulator with XRE-family HTH domain
MTQFVLRHPEDLGTAVAEFRTLRGLTQAQLALDIGVHRTYLSNVERGEVPEYIKRYFALVGALGLQITIADA